ncbi:MAG TPA: DUF1570 domain-containing protein [Phycisphaerae bacterium]|nr:DUF1570 domain-containing protein [Phycisphaerae bacterium]
MNICKHHRGWISSGLLLGLVAFAVCGCSSHDEAIQFTEEPWSFRKISGTKLSTEHFDIHSTLRDHQLQQALPEFLEAAYDQYSTLLPPPASGEGKRLQTYVLNDRSQWDLYARTNFPGQYPVFRKISAGGFAVGNECVVYYIQRTYTLSVLAHEGMHQYFANYFSTRLPAWLNEGLATYCESYELPSGKARFTPQRNTFRLNAMRDAMTTDAVLPLRALLETDAGRVINQGRSRLTKTYYAQAWALVCFLRHGANGKYADGFQNMLNAIVSGELESAAKVARIQPSARGKTSYGESVFRAYITDDLDTLEAEFRDYLFELVGFSKPQ